MKTLTQTPERRKFTRHASAARFEVNLLNPPGRQATTTVNFSEGGLCLRLREAIDVRSLVRFQLTPEEGAHAVECTGRVAWVVQRLDLRAAPPFLYDVGIEFVEFPSSLRQLMVPSSGRMPSRTPRIGKIIPPVIIRNRRYVPRIERMLNHPTPWHLIVLVDGTPCFSGHYVSERQVLVAWNKFKRLQGGK